jgi:hypothetical protein
LLLIQTDASEAVAAAEAIFAVLRLAAILAVLTVIAGVARCAVDAFRTPFAGNAECQTGARYAFAGIAGVVDIFGIKNAEAVVTVTGLHCCIRIIAVIGANLLEVVAWFFNKEPLEIIYETFVRGTSRRL